MDLSVTDPIERAIDRTKAILFQPFHIGKWFGLGFCAFLAQMGSVGTGFNSFNRFGSHDAGEKLQSIADPVKGWILAHLLLVAILGLLALALGFLLAWVQARGHFMFLDGVVRNRSGIAAPWKNYASEGNSLFGFNLAFGCTVLAGIAIIAGLGVLIALPDIRTEEFGGRALTALLLAIPMLLAFLVAASVVTVLLQDFVIPAMYLRRQGVLEAWGTVRREVLAGRAGTIVLYFLMKMALAIGIGILAFVAMCLTCCCAILPYIGTVILLPLFVFSRSYPLYFLQQLGPAWRFIGEPETAPEAMPPADL